MKGLFIRVDDELNQALDDVCRKEGFKKSGLVTKLIRDFLRTASGGERDAVREAEKFGIDISLIEENLKKSPTERLRDHAQAYGFVEALRKGKPIPQT